MENRRRLGIPDDVDRVLVLAESSHWDPDWMLTSEQYFRLGVGRTLDRVLDELAREPRRIWNVDCVFFLAMYWERRPGRRGELIELINSGRMRLTTSGVTTQDTLVPTTESVLRDFLVGQQWLRSHGMTQEPRLAYFPDSFGHSPSLPSLLQAAGFDRTVVTRIDGAYFIGTDWERRRRFPKPGSSAEALTAAGSADFIWRDAQGSEVLAHWHPFTYGQGDMVGSVGIFRYMSAPLTVRDRSEKRVAARLERYADQLTPLARTPYLLCPIGLDFAHPIADLFELIDRYNHNRAPDSGLWVVNAATDDYLDLVESHRAELPILQFDPNPYWTGFYASRPELKRSHRRLSDALIAAEAESVALDVARAKRQSAELSSAWWTAAVGNHHDFVTGTSPDRVVRREQEPWLRDALALVERKAGVSAEERSSTEMTVTGPGVGVVELEWVDGRLHANSGRLGVIFDPALGGCVTSVRVDGRETVVGPAGDLIAYDDSGGLWRLGSEYRGGHLRPVDRTSSRRGTVTTETRADGSAVIEVEALLDEHETRRSFELSPGSASMVVRTKCAAGDRRTVTLALPLVSTPESLVMDQPGGVVVRPLRRGFDPTLWPVASWLVAQGTEPSLALGVEMTRAVTVRSDATVEVVVARNAVQERAWRFVPILACPARGHEPGETEAAIALRWATDEAPWLQGHWAASLVEDPLHARFKAAVERVFTLEDDGREDGVSSLEVLAVKPADRGEGIVVRLADRTGQGAIRAKLRTVLPLASAVMCDVRERDLEPAEIHPYETGSEVSIAAEGSVVSLRLIPE